MARSVVGFRGLTSPSAHIAAGLGLGVALGLFLGESASVLNVVASGYVQLLRMTVLPYVTVSLMAGVGSLTAAQARLMATRVGAVLLALWTVTLALVFLMPVTFPHWESASFFSTALIEHREPFDFLAIYIPANPFFSLANSVVPAVVFFSVTVGVALIGADDKEAFLGWLRVVRKALGDVTTFTVRLAPIGLCAVAAVLAGTLRPEDMQRVQVYLIAYGAFSALLALWIIPGLICALTPIRYGEVFGLTRDALVTAFLTGELFVVLPVLSEASHQLVRRYAPPAVNADGLTDVIVPASFNFPHAGKVLSLSFVLFAAWFSETPVSWTQTPVLAATGLLTFFASLNAAVPYLLDVMRIPADTFQLFLATGLINSRVGTTLAAVHTLAVAILGALAIAGGLSFSARRLLRYAAISVALTLGLTIGLRVVFDRAEHPYTRDRVVAGMHLARSDVATRVSRTAAVERLESDDTSLSQLERIRARGRIRIGYLPASLPFAFFNERDELVGFDVEMANRLARELGVGLEFLPADEDRFWDQLDEGSFDLVMSGVALTTLRAERMAFSEPYLDEHLAFITEDHRRNEFATLDSIRRLPGVRLGVPNVPYYIQKMRDLFPNAEVVVLPSRDDFARFFAHGPGSLDALAWTAERGSAWSLLYPRFSVAIPQSQIVSVPLAYPVARCDQAFVAFLDRWLELKKRDGTLQELYDYWILGKNAQPVAPRWSVGHDVLHWW